MTHLQVLLVVQGVFGMVLLGAVGAEWWKIIRLRRKMSVETRRIEDLVEQAKRIRDKYMQDRAEYRCMHCVRREKESRP